MKCCHCRMCKLERLNARVTKLLTEAVHEVLEMVKETVSEYQQKTTRTLRENESLKKRLQELQGKITTEFTHGSLPEEKEAIEHPAQRHSLDVTLTEQMQVSIHKLDYDMKPESKEREGDTDSESPAECDLAQVSTEHCKAQPEEGTHTIEEEMTIQTFHNSNTNISALSSDNVRHSNSSSSYGVKHSIIKRESEPTDCTISKSSSLQEHYSGCVDLGLNSSYQSAAESFRHQVATEPYGFILVQSNSSTQRKHGLTKTSRVSFDVRKIRREHLKRDDSHVCVVCGKTFSRVGNLRIHQHSHRGVKPYGCIQCGKPFSHGGDLKKHKRVHTGEKPYYCNQCGKSFSRGENLKRHQKIHQR
ncbi:Zinc finger protein 596 [Channa argus]|uniref:Zinc finger protein 596 n=1 Tax=Channa argus TaxID=215402 RepID=A0A6G1QQ24_CHAAH|nr:Zinc finger protein 596 [Channa argus]